MSATYHSDFWMAVTATAPVVMLAHVVTYDRTRALMRSSDRFVRRLSLWAGLAVMALGVLLPLCAFFLAVRSLMMEQDAGGLLVSGWSLLASVTLIFIETLMFYFIEAAHEVDALTEQPPN